MEDVDISSILNGNPGIGGTQFEMFLLANLFFLKRDNDLDFNLLLTYPQKGIENKYINVKNLEDVVAYCNTHSVDILIMRENKKIHVLNLLTRTKVIFWVHNFLNFRFIKEIGNCEKVNRVVFVSKQHYDYYLEYNVNRKASYIYNAVSFKDTRCSIGENKDNIVVFTGNIVPIKRLHLVTKMWPSIIKKVPDAQLYVIGTGANAHRDAKLGPFNIAEDSYEQIILKPLIKTKTLDTVRFLGILGSEKNQIIRKAKAGISPNKQETFCLSAAEYILNGTPVIGVAKGGLNDVVINRRTGYLYRSQRKIKKTIIKILTGKITLNISNEDLNKMELKFGFEAFYKAWKSLLFDVYNDVPAVKLKASKPIIDKGKFIGVICRFFRDVFHLPEWFSRLGLYSLIRRRKS